MKQRLSEMWHHEMKAAWAGARFRPSIRQGRRRVYAEARRRYGWRVVFNHFDALKAAMDRQMAVFVEEKLAEAWEE